MNKKRYYIKRLYINRSSYTHHNDISFQDEYQLEVYLFALGLMKKHNLKSVIDIGCGSGYKLVTYLGEYDTLGIELPENVAWLKKTYPERKWEAVDFGGGENLSADVVICADVIEHLVDPDELLDFIKKIRWQYCIFSTPCRSLRFLSWRDILRLRWVRKIWGPPGQRAHVREWSYEELNRYLSQHFIVTDHRVTNINQTTQMVVCKPKS